MKTLTLLLTLALASFAHAAEAFVVAGQPFTVFVAKVDGTPPFTYQWRKDGVDLPGQTAATYNVKAATAADAGLYSVRITNAAGSTISDNAAATIVVKPANAVSAITTGAAPASASFPGGS